VKITEARQKALKTDAALVRLQKQRRLLLKKRRAIVAREQQNIKKLKIDELIAKTSGIRIPLERTSQKSFI